MKRTRILLLTLTVCSVLAAQTSAAQDLFRVTLIGTGTPESTPERFGPSTLIEARNQKLLIDAGRGVPIRLGQLGIPLKDLTVVFLTHLHSDHTVGIPDIWLTGWLPSPANQRVTPFRIIGPIGTKSLMLNLEKAYAGDIKIREDDQKLSAEGVAVQAEEVTHEGIVYEQDGVRVTAFDVDHGAAIKPAYGYRIDFEGRSVVISGDTRFNENVIKYATDADLLVHEVSAANPELQKIPAMRLILAHHTSLQEAGVVFTRAHPKLAVYSHIGHLSTRTIPEVTPAEMVSETRKTYKGPLVVGEDLMTFDIASGGIAVFRAAR